MAKSAPALDRDEPRIEAPPSLADPILGCLNRLDGFEKCPRVAVAVSGGADSMALAWALGPWVKERDGTLHALIVDHRLRGNSALEARQCAARLRRRSIPCRILSLSDVPRSNLQAELRRHRFALLSDWCQSHGVLHLFLAHHAQDQAETFLYRLARGSGVDGLAAMSVVTVRPEMRILRPLLDLPRQQLRDFLRRHHASWIEDPANSQRRFARTRLRQSAAILADEGLSRQRITRTCAHMRRARAALDRQAAARAGAISRVHPEGYIVLRHGPMRDIRGDAAGRILAAALCCVSGQPTRPRWESLARLRDHIGRRDGFPPTTLHGCWILYRKRDAGTILICREPAAIGAPQPLEKGKRVVWDGRFSLAPIDAVPIHRPGENLCWKACPPRRKLPPWPHPWPILQTLPVLHAGEEPIYAPHIGFRARHWRIRVPQGTQSVRWTPARPFFD